MKPKFKTTKALYTSVWFAAIALVCSDHAAAADSTVTGNLTVTGNTTGNGWALFKQGVDFGNAGEAMLNWVPGTSPAGTCIFDIKWADGSFLWRDTVTSTASNKMNLDAANNLMLYKANGTVGITLAPETGKITLPTGSGIYFGTSSSATLAATASGAAIFPSQVTLQNGLVSSGNMNISSTTASTSTTTGALTVAGGLGVVGAVNAGSDSYINGIRIGKGAGNVATNTAVGFSALNANITGASNLALGYQSLYSNNSGSYNSAAGYLALFSNTTGTNNVGFGKEAGYGNATGILNVFLGDSAGKFQANGTTSLSTTNRSIYIGAGSRGFNTSDDNSIVIGHNAIGEGANTTVIGNSNTTNTHLYGNLVTGNITSAGSPVLTVASASNGPVSLSSGTASGTYSTAMSGGTANADYSTALSSGYACGTYSTALSNSSAYGYSSTAMSGAYTDSIADYSTAMSCGSAYGYYSTAMSGGQAYGQYSLASGYLASAHSYSGTSLGSFNNSWGTPDTWVETDPHFTVGNGTETFDPEYSVTYSNAITTLKNGQTTLTNKAWKADPNVAPAPENSNAEALVVEGHARLKGKIVIEQVQGDISMGIYE